MTPNSGSGETPMAPLDVLVIGAGRTGLTMASELLLHGASVRIIDAQVDQPRESRALGVQARTLELLDRRGLARDLISRAIPPSQAPPTSAQYQSSHARCVASRRSCGICRTLGCRSVGQDLPLG
jgi:2-polyprenyl-6-methoxyphenol hydroxylase-like FAD-dependent oxidoreductase